MHTTPMQAGMEAGVFCHRNNPSPTEAVSSSQPTLMEISFPMTEAAVTLHKAARDTSPEKIFQVIAS